MKLERLLAAIRPLHVSGACERDITGVVCDSRKAREGSLFVAVGGTRADGWAYVADAVQRGAVAVVSGHEAAVPGRTCSIRVEDPREALALLACEFHDQPSRRLQIAGVTGTNGKTTITFMLREILEAAGRTPGMLTTIRYDIGHRSIPATRTTPEAPVLQGMLAEMLASGCHSAVMEASSHALDQKRTDGIDFDAAVFTNLSRDHLDYHHDMEHYFKAKERLFTNLGRGGKAAFAVINRDDEWGRRLLAARGAHTALSYSITDPGADLRAAGLELRQDGSTFTMETPWGRCDVRLPMAGRFNVMNALAAAGTAGALGVDIKTAGAALTRMAGVPGRLEDVRAGQDFRVLVDYAHTDHALEQVLTTLAELNPKRLIVVFGCGGDRDRSKRPVMGAVAARLADLQVLTSDNPRTEDPLAILAEIQAGFPKRARPVVIPDRGEAIQHAIDAASTGDIVLIAGKGHETFQETVSTTVSFDDRQMARRCIERRLAGREAGRP